MQLADKDGCPEIDICLEQLRAYLASRGGRLTPERRLLVQVICDYRGHFVPEDLQAPLVERGEHVAMTTIYRNLPALEAAGIIRRTTFREAEARGAATYEHVLGRPHHDHLLCQVCGERVEFSYDAIEILQESVARQHGFRLVTHHLELVGICSACQSQEVAA